MILNIALLLSANKPANIFAFKKVILHRFYCVNDYRYMYDNLVNNVHDEGTIYHAIEEENDQYPGH